MSIFTDPAPPSVPSHDATMSAQLVEDAPAGMQTSSSNNVNNSLPRPQKNNIVMSIYQHLVANADKPVSSLMNSLPAEAAFIETPSPREGRRTLAHVVGEVLDTRNPLTKAPFRDGPVPLEVEDNTDAALFHLWRVIGYDWTEIIARVSNMDLTDLETKDDAATDGSKAPRPKWQTKRSTFSMKVQRFHNNHGIMELEPSRRFSSNEDRGQKRKHTDSEDATDNGNEIGGSITYKSITKSDKLRIAKLSDLQLLFGIWWDIHQDGTMSQPWIVTAGHSKPPAEWKPLRYPLPRPEELNERFTSLLTLAQRPVPTISTIPATLLNAVAADIAAPPAPTLAASAATAPQHVVPQVIDPHLAELCENGLQAKKPRMASPEAEAARAAPSLVAGWEAGKLHAREVHLAMPRAQKLATEMAPHGHNGDAEEADAARAQVHGSHVEVGGAAALLPHRPAYVAMYDGNQYGEGQQHNGALFYDEVGSQEYLHHHHVHHATPVVYEHCHPAVYNGMAMPVQYRQHLAGAVELEAAMVEDGFAGAGYLPNDVYAHGHHNGGPYEQLLHQIRQQQQQDGIGADEYLNSLCSSLVGNVSSVYPDESVSYSYDPSHPNVAMVMGYDHNQCPVGYHVYQQAQFYSQQLTISPRRLVFSPTEVTGPLDMSEPVEVVEQSDAQTYTYRFATPEPVYDPSLTDTPSEATELLDQYDAERAAESEREKEDDVYPVEVGESADFWNDF